MPLQIQCHALKSITSPCMLILPDKPNIASYTPVWSEVSNSNSLVDTILYSINLTVSVDKFAKICSFINFTFAVSVYFIKLGLIHVTGDYEMVQSCRSNEVTHLVHVCILSGSDNILYFQMHSKLLTNIATCWNLLHRLLQSIATTQSYLVIVMKSIGNKLQK